MSAYLDAEQVLCLFGVFAFDINSVNPSGQAAASEKWKFPAEVGAAECGPAVGPFGLKANPMLCEDVLFFKKGLLLGAEIDFGPSKMCIRDRGVA